MILTLDLIAKAYEKNENIILIFLGLIITSLVNYSTQALLIKRKDKFEAKNLACSLLSEMKAINDISRKRNYLNCFKRESKALAPSIRHIHVNQNYIGVYENNLDKIGKLDFKVSKEIIVFYTQVKSILEDLNTLNSFESQEEILSSELALLYKELYELIESCYLIEDKISKEINNLYEK